MAEWMNNELLHYLSEWQIHEVANTRPQTPTKRRSDNLKYIGDVAEWLKAPHSKCGIWETVSEVQILSSPQFFKKISILQKLQNGRLAVMARQVENRINILVI